MTPPLDLQAALSELIGDAHLVPCPLPGTALSLWLLDADNMDRAFSPEETRRILHEPPYWSFCWVSGLALARYLAANPEWVAGKRVAGFWRRFGRGRYRRREGWRAGSGGLRS